ncbi:MAG: type IV pili twitching motility protein PilT [endosymbiont of Galathealinum brachiosum]|uniref:Type IV pili twitching motility protein PilT n=1 Tax=endosymbiont of Galathealinum brachiosum TaxID=2200906 RepID=A0A370DFE9_9GAMM|nr:MAG: type IV pili twitching motility protein PilT [endosymbiont of Galathealinum brachiosum]
MNLQPYLKLMAERGGSDIFFTTGAPVSMNIEGKMHPIGKTPLEPGMTKEIAYSVMDENQKMGFEATMEMNLGMSLKDIGRFRINIYTQRGEVSMVIRYIKSDVPTLDKLNLPPKLKDLVFNRKGLVLVVGATGSGKSTTLASMINHRSLNMPGHILTIEDPIEYMFDHQKSIVGQREVGLDTLSYENALREAMREAPDVIMIGEVRDRETMEAAIQYADTGHLCLTTLHSVNANQTLDRILSFFPPDARNQILMDLSLNLQAIVSQRLVEGLKGKRVAAIEILINSPYISELIRRGDFHEIKEIMEKGEADGMQTFDQSLYQLFSDGKIDIKTALSYADSRSNLEWKINFGGGVKEMSDEKENETLQFSTNPDDLPEVK